MVAGFNFPTMENKEKSTIDFSFAVMTKCHLIPFIYLYSFSLFAVKRTKKEIVIRVMIAIKLKI